MGEKMQFTELDQYLFGQGTHSVSVIGSFNDWDEEANPMTKVGPIGVYETFIPGAKIGDLYKFFIVGMHGEKLYKADPYANESELRPGTASRVTDITDYAWKDAVWIKNRQEFDEKTSPMSIYEVHPGSWRKHPVTEEDPDGFIYACRADGDRGASFRRFLGLSGNGILFSHLPLWNGSGF